ncbi:MAG: hypothetical protein HS104_22615 [Polyangiaceae bacterium]|nr:hypothetical protein [Polyangiaceae bacterium]MCL4750075.1 hypothetical protein [Myxococcales bacterium]
MRVVATLMGLALLGCGDPEARKVTDRFLGALKQSDYRAAYAELHSDARTFVPNEGALQNIIEKKGKVITDWSRNCSSGGKGVDRGGYNFSSTTKSLFQKDVSVTVGVEPKREKCNGPLLIELHQEGGAWKVRSFRY